MCTVLSTYLVGNCYEGRWEVINNPRTLSYGNTYMEGKDERHYYLEEQSLSNIGEQYSLVESRFTLLQGISFSGNGVLWST